jgi:hypothetical protein
LSSVAAPAVKEAARPPHPNWWLRAPDALPTDVGLNRTSWDLRLDAPLALSHTFEINANPGLTPTSPEGVLAPPGTYTIRLTVKGVTQSRKVTITNDPRSPATAPAIRAQYALLRKHSDGANVAFEGFQQTDAMLKALKERTPKDSATPVAKAITAFRAVVDSVGNGSAPPGPARRAAPDFAGLNRQFTGVVLAQDLGDQAPTAAMLAGYALTCRELGTAARKWNEINRTGLVSLNAILTRSGIQAVPAAAGVTAPSCGEPVRTPPHRNSTPSN